jgi:putative DNA primase/helicase
VTADLDLFDALNAVSPDIPRDEWVRVGMALHAAGADFDDFNAWSSRGATYSAQSCRDTWRSFRAGRGIGAGTLFSIARLHGWTPSHGTSKPPVRHVERPRAAATPKPPIPDIVHALWRDSEPLSGTPAEHYLLARACVIPPEHEDALRFIPNLLHRPTNMRHPAMVAANRDPVTNELLGLHRTYLRADGCGKAEVSPARMMLGKKAGGVIKLWNDELVTHGLAIAEGIETALSIAHAFKPAWSCLDAGNLAAFPVLAGIESLTIAADHDEAGIRAAEECAARWHAAGREVRIVLPPAPGADLNDVAQEVEA